MNTEFMDKAIEIMSIITNSGGEIKNYHAVQGSISKLLSKWSEQDIEEGMEIVMESPGEYIDMDAFIDESRE